MFDWISPSVLKDVLLSVVALYGAVLSTFNYTQSVRKERRSVVVSLSTAMPTYGATVGDCFAKIEAINAGHRSVTISTLALEFPEGQRLFSTGSVGAPGVSDTQLPISLADGQSAQMFFSYKDIGNTLVSHGRTQKIKLTPICIDSFGTVYKGKLWDVDPREFQRM
jgi:hypothetical protein